MKGRGCRSLEHKRAKSLERIWKNKMQRGRDIPGPEGVS